jgi:hypothetical protein
MAANFLRRPFRHPTVNLDHERHKSPQKTQSHGTSLSAATPATTECLADSQREVSARECVPVADGVDSVRPQTTILDATSLIMF